MFTVQTADVEPLDPKTNILGLSYISSLEVAQLWLSMKWKDRFRGYVIHDTFIPYERGDPLPALRPDGTSVDNRSFLWPDSGLKPVENGYQVKAHEVVPREGKGPFRGYRLWSDDPHIDVIDEMNCFFELRDTKFSRFLHRKHFYYEKHWVSYQKSLNKYLQKQVILAARVKNSPTYIHSPKFIPIEIGIPS